MCAAPATLRKVERVDNAFAAAVKWFLNRVTDKEVAAVWNGPDPATREDLEVIDEAPGGALANDLPSQPAVFAPDYEPEEIAEIATKLRQAAAFKRSRPARWPTGRHPTACAGRDPRDREERERAQQPGRSQEERRPPSEDERCSYVSLAKNELVETGRTRG